MRYDTVFLDMGFTLVDIVPSMAAILAQAVHDVHTHRVGPADSGLRVTGRDALQADLQEAMDAVWSDVLGAEPMVWENPSEEADRQWIRDINRRILARLGITTPADAISDRAYHLFSQPSAYRVYDDVWPALDALRARGCRLGIVSNWGWRLHDVCQGLGLTPYFDAILASARVGFEKPHPAFFHHALATLDADPARTVHVGDNVRTDVAGARGVGLAPILLVRDGRSVPDEPGCPVIHTLLDLPAALERTPLVQHARSARNT